MKTKRQSSKLAGTVATILVAIVITACGGGGSDGATNVTPPTPAGPVTGGVFSSGSFVVTIVDKSIPQNVNAAPIATAVGAVPPDIKISSYETNVTSGAKAYTLKIGNKGFRTATVGKVRLEVPFDPSLVPDRTKIDSLHLLLRILNVDDKSVVSLTGQIVGDKVVADLTGFPSSATVTVLFNPNMDVAANDASATPVVNSAARLATLTNPTWGARNWAVVYDAVAVAPAIKTFLGTSVAPTAAQIKLAIKQQIANHAADAAATYQGAGFRSPTLYVAKTTSEVGGADYGITPRYLIHYQIQEGSNYTSNAKEEVIEHGSNNYGRLYIQDSRINYKSQVEGSTIYASIAHELLHAVQDGYGLFPENFNGVAEGTATAYGVLLDRRHDGDSAAMPQVRQRLSDPNYIKLETFKLDNYLMVFRTDQADAYSNQDFFVYLARTIGNNDFKFLATLFEQLQLTAEDEANKQATPDMIANSLSNPDYATVLKGFDRFLSGNYNSTLLTTYNAFVQQRAIEHNTASQFGRPDETTEGVAASLFNNYPNALGILDGRLDPTSVDTSINDLRPLDQLSARAIRLRPQAGATGGDITITVAPSVGSLGTTLLGWIYRKPSATATRTSTPLLASNLVSGFGADSSDEVAIILVNPSFEISGVGVNCEIKSVAKQPGALSGTSPTVVVKPMAVPGMAATPGTIPSDATLVGNGDWSMTGVGIQLVRVSDTNIYRTYDIYTAHHVYIYAPEGSKGRLTINSNAVWGNAPREVVEGTTRSVYTYHQPYLMPFQQWGNYLIWNATLGYPIVSKSISGSSMIIDYSMPSQPRNGAGLPSGSTEFQIAPDFGFVVDRDDYNFPGGTLFGSTKGTEWTVNSFFSVTVSNNMDSLK